MPLRLYGYLVYCLVGKKKAHLLLPRGPKAKLLRQKGKVKQAPVRLNHLMMIFINIKNVRILDAEHTYQLNSIDLDKFLYR